MKAAVLVLLVAALLCAVGAKSLVGDRVLVLLDDLAVRDTHSLFFHDLAERGYKLSFFRSDAAGLALSKYGEYQYDHVILFAPSASTFGGDLETAHLIEFIDNGGNVLVAADAGIADAVHEVAVECGVKFAEAGGLVTDHFQFEAPDSDHTLIASSAFNQEATAVFGKKPAYAPVLFRGVGHDIDDDHNPLLFRLLTAHATSFAAPTSAEGKPAVFGKRTTLVSALQARNNARVVFSGSLELFSNKLFAHAAGGKASGNREFVRDVTQWLFKERAVLRAENVRHHRAGESQAPAVYRIKDEIEYEVDIHEWNGAAWVPFKASDVQLEFVMLDPYVRLPLLHDTKGHYYKRFTAPDVYGIFTFRVDYQRLGYSNILLRTTVSVRPFRHDEYERFIVAAYPYYAGAFSMLAGLFVFSVVFLYHKDSSAPKN